MIAGALDKERTCANTVIEKVQDLYAAKPGVVVFPPILGFQDVARAR